MRTKCPPARLPASHPRSEENQSAKNSHFRQWITRCLSLSLVLAVLCASAGPLPGTAKSGGKKFKTVTRTFSNGGAITIPEEGAATPYPSAINVAGFKKGKIKDVDLRLNGFSHVIVNDVDILLVAPGNRSAIVMSDVADGETVNDVDLTLDDQAAAELPQEEELASGAFQPLNVDESELDEFPTPAPAPNGNVALSVFNGANPNGQWRLFVVDDQDGFTGSIAGGWELKITAKAKKNKNGKGKRK